MQGRIIHLQVYWDIRVDLSYSTLILRQYTVHILICLYTQTVYTQRCVYI